MTETRASRPTQTTHEDVISAPSTSIISIHPQQQQWKSFAVACLFSPPRVAALGVHFAPNSSTHRTHVCPSLVGNFFSLLTCSLIRGGVWKLPATDDPANHPRLRSTFTLASLIGVEFSQVALPQCEFVGWRVRRVLCPGLLFAGPTRHWIRLS
jgi:hypothetical protein